MNCRQPSNAAWWQLSGKIRPMTDMLIFAAPRSLPGRYSLDLSQIQWLGVDSSAWVAAGK